MDHLPVDVPASQPRQDVPRRFDAEEIELVVIRTYQNGLDADLAKTVLEAAGIESMIRGDDTARRYYVGLPFDQRIELLVRSEDAEDAEDAEKILDIDATDADS